MTYELFIFNFIFPPTQLKKPCLDLWTKKHNQCRLVGIHVYGSNYF